MRLISIRLQTCIILILILGVGAARAQIQTFSRYKGKLSPVVDCYDSRCYVLDDGRKELASFTDVEVRPGKEFGPGYVEITEIQIDLDPLRKLDPKKQIAPTSVKFRFEAQVMATTTPLKNCYGLITFVSKGSVGIKMVPIGSISPGEKKHIKVELTHRVDAMGLLHVFSQGSEVKSSQRPQAYDAHNYFSTLTQGIQGVSAVALCHSEDRYSHQLSRDGTKLATTRKRDTHMSLIVYDLASMKLLQDYNLGDKGESAWNLTWVSDREVALIYNDPKTPGYSSLGLFNIDSGKLEQMEPRVERIVTVVKNRPNLLTLYSRRWQYRSQIAKYDLKTRSVVAKDRLQEGSTTFDDNGDERIRYEPNGDSIICYYKATADAAWRRLDKDNKQAGLKFDREGKGFLDRACEIHSIGPDGDTLYISSRMNSDRFELAAYSLSKCQVVKTIATSPIYDLASDDEGYSRLLFRKDSSELIGIHYAADKPHVTWFDPVFVNAQKSIDAALPKYVNVPQDWSADGKAIVYFSYSDRDPGGYYLLRTEESRLVLLHSLGDQLQNARLGHTEPFNFKARDGATIHAYVTYPPDFSKEHPSPMVVDIHGGPMARDDWGFSATNQFLATHGYVVLQVNYRGSSGFGAEYQKKGLYSRLDTVVLDDIADGAYFLIKQGVADPGRVAVMGASFGGWATYMSLIKYPELYRAGIAISAISHWKKQLKHDHAMYNGEFSYALWTDLLKREDFAVNEKFIDPLLRSAELKQPIYIMHGERDSVVDATEARRMLDALKKSNARVEAMSFPRATHSYWSLADRVSRMNEIEGFLRRCLAPSTEAETPK